MQPQCLSQQRAPEGHYQSEVACGIKISLEIKVMGGMFVCLLHSATIL